MTEWEQEFGTGAPEGMAHLMREVIDGHMARAMSDNQWAALAWNRANGDRERAHTTGVFLKPSRAAGAAPVLGVYVDSHALVTDFGVNKDIYLARLANVGFEVSGIDFLPSRPGRKRAATPKAAPAPDAQSLPPLTPQEQAEVADLVSCLPPDLRESASKAVSLSKRRQKSQGATS